MTDGFSRNDTETDVYVIDLVDSNGIVVHVGDSNSTRQAHVTENES
jgi:hypothetical protein